MYKKYDSIIVVVEFENIDKLMTLELMGSLEAHEKIRRYEIYTDNVFFWICDLRNLKKVRATLRKFWQKKEKKLKANKLKIILSFMFVAFVKE